MGYQMTTNHDTQAMEPGPSQSTTTIAPPPTNAAHILVLAEPQVVPVGFPAAAKPLLGKTNAYLDDPEEDDEDAPLSPRVKLTGYRLLNIFVIFTIGLAKFILSLKGRSIAPTGLEWAGGSVLTILLYWIGLYEAVEPPMWGWFFHVDRAPVIILSSKCFLGGVLASLVRVWKDLPMILVLIIHTITFIAFFPDPSIWIFLAITHVIAFLGVFLLRSVPTRWLVWHRIPVWAPVRRFFRRYGEPNSQARGSRYRNVCFYLGFIQAVQHSGI